MDKCSERRGTSGPEEYNLGDAGHKVSVRILKRTDYFSRAEF